jgi:putative membrane protein
MRAGREGGMASQSLPTRRHACLNHSPIEGGLMRHSNLFAAVAISALLAAPFAHAASSTTENFVRNASIGSQFEIESSKLALQKSSNPEIKQFAQMMIDDHTKASEQMKSDLKGDEAALASTTLDAKHQAQLDQLQKASGASFDAAYVKDQKAAHKEAIDLFSDYAKSGDDTALKNFATQTLPTLQMHQQHVKELKS